ncbi:SMI1/KNR4 family protein [Kitasatospora sp. NPDC051914]|uniref:SMI1/KNR4 family protein n=1 Tax=Kitasatospora sp. NPDC051914 TaxID=3154945 RepID=UPI00343F2F68
MGGLAQILSCIGPTCGDTADWKAAEAVYGRPLPSDYRWFIETFGRGTIEQMVVVRGPATGRAEWEGIRVDTLPPEMVSETDDWHDPAPEGLYRLEDMLVRAHTNAADVLCWVAAEPDPDRWPVAVWSRCHAAWTVYPFGMAEFLVGLLCDRFEEWPISDSGLRGDTSPRFLHDDEEAAAELGTDPWD